MSKAESYKFMSLLNVDYKIFAGIWEARLNAIVGEYIRRSTRLYETEVYEEQHQKGDESYRACSDQERANGVFLLRHG